MAFKKRCVGVLVGVKYIDACGGGVVVRYNLKGCLIGIEELQT